jgi:drug/metabolite transporter (DMT)-like permease/endonuclease YncB( thermonuclease family)
MSFLIFIILTSLLWGVGQVLVKKGLSYLSPWHSYALDTLSAIILWIPYGLFVEGFSWHAITIPSILLSLFIGIIYSFFYYVIEKGPISIISPIFSTAPVFTAVFSYFLLKEVLTFPQICAVIVTVVGVILLSVPHAKEHLTHVRSWIFYTILLTLAFSFETIASKYVIDVSGNGAFMILFAFGQAATVAGWYIISPPKKIIPKIHHRYFFPSLVGVFMFNAGTITWALALEHNLASLVAALSNLYIVVLVVFSALYLKEKIIRRQYVGIILVILGVIFVNIFQAPNHQNSGINPAINQVLTGSPTPFLREKAHVSFVIDGDTFVLSTGEHVRLIGVDAPENNKYNPVQCFGPESSRMLTTLVGSQDIELEKDTSEKDTYNRLLRYVYQDGVFINNLLVEQGYARVLSVPPDLRYRTTLLQSQSTAMKENRGIWDTCK